jgi:multisubunit Na+/H+ antiporter MnhB subunit
LVTALVSLALGAGGLGYSIFWMWAGFRAPGLGSTGAAKESLKWLAMPSSGGFVLATIAVLIALLAWMVVNRGQETSQRNSQP